MKETDPELRAALLEDIRGWAAELGFQQLGVTDVDLGEHEGYLQKWLDAGYHGTMDYMARHGSKRSRPGELVPGTCAERYLAFKNTQGQQISIDDIQAEEKRLGLDRPRDHSL